MKCPICSVERRLRDSFYHWRDLEKSYFSPDRFRIVLNTLIQETRNVTFILQKNKAKIPGFEQWYDSWRERMKSDEILKWAVDSRNVITKQGDLETHSMCLVKFTSGWDDKSTFEFRANPLAKPSKITEEVISHVPRFLITEEALICIERRWIDSRLPNLELLQATAHVLLILTDMTRDLHETILDPLYPALQCELSVKLQNFRKTFPFELAEVDDTRKVWVGALDSEEIKYDLAGCELQRSSDIFNSVKERYHIEPYEDKENVRENSMLATMKRFAVYAKSMLIKDGRLRSVALVLDKVSGSFYSIALIMRSRVDKHLAIRRVGLFLERCKVEWVILVGESWIAKYDEERPIRHAVECAGRGEAITLNGVSRRGEFANVVVPFVRQDAKISFLPAWEDENPANIMLPLLASIREK